MPGIPTLQVGTLQAYLDRLRRLLHDPEPDRLWPAADKIEYINEGMQRRDLDTGCNRIMQALTLQTGVDLYHLTDLANKATYDVININLIWGNIRTPMNQSSKVELDARARALLMSNGVPDTWARHGQNDIYFGPKPSLPYATEWDCAVIAPTLLIPEDNDPVPYPWTKPVPYYAAWLAKMNERQYDDADKFMKLYLNEIQVCQGARTGLVPSVYGRW